MASTSLGLNKLQAYDSESDSDSPSICDDNEDDDKSKDKVSPTSAHARKECNKRSCNFLTNGNGCTDISAKRSRIQPHPDQKTTKCMDTTSSPDDNTTKDAPFKQSLPSVPFNILQMFHTGHVNEKPKDEPSAHMGRIRSFPHVRGNWASYIYVHCQETLDVINELNNLICDTLKSMDEKEDLIHPMHDKHLTLSRTLALRHHWIEPLIDNLKRSISTCPSFDLCLDEFDVYTNEEKSRTFISMNVLGTSQLFDVVKKCDACLMDFQLEPYYKCPSFHVSCAWMLGDKTEWAKQSLIPVLNKKWSDLRHNPDMQLVPVSTVELKTGNQLYRFYLQK